jgi:hypothetical protein
MLPGCEAREQGWHRLTHMLDKSTFHKNVELSIYVMAERGALMNLLPPALVLTKTLVPGGGEVR